MQSKWFHLKDRATNMRKQGYSIRYIEKKLGISKSTLSGWFSNITLTSEQKSHLQNDWLEGLIKARTKAILWHNQQKATRLKLAEAEAIKTLSKIDTTDNSILELAVAMLYLGEGTKKGLTSMGNSNILIVKFFIECLIRLYKVDIGSIKFDLHLRADQNAVKIKEYWSKGLGFSLDHFKYVAFDKRTTGSNSYPTYMGVCVIRCGNVALQRRMVYLSHRFCEEIANQRAV